MNRTQYGINHKMRVLHLFGALALLSLVLAACAPAASPTPAQNTPVPAASATAQPAPTQASTASGSGYGSGSSSHGVTVNVAQSTALGTILVDGKGMTLYAWKNDQPGVSTCAGKCLANWPPLLASGTLTAGTGLTASDFGTAQTTDGRTMITYNNQPLYYFIGDKNPGDTKGQGIGNVWFVVAPKSTGGSGSQPSTQGVAVNVSQNAKLGNILVDAKGMTLYMWKNDKMNVSTCAGKCLTNWPPLLASSAVTPGTDLNASDFGTTQTTDGRTMVTYKGAPLYYFIGDKNAGDTNGQGIGNVWYVVAP